MKEQHELRLKALENAYTQLINVLNKKLDLAEVDPEKLAVSLSAYAKAAKESKLILGHIEDTKIQIKSYN